ncbi:hypothetical protein K469DRAFT_745456 [Zopfia rhizophila CBS 207.26]|uniref:Peptidase M3A/M3B catalytic domain-containing protein n=1 Tax=Zopfia rhizophila CBS 207.26 TaxID=1314779 RepID=A0A6A6ELM9_9PEZI|nr:hypothetical protein K469DRAFT_745456 [Zopfia rhizophila CBS 207.26]
MTVINFGEAPSQMLEKWCREPSILILLSQRYSYLSPEAFKAWEEDTNGKPQPPENIPDGMIESLIRAKNVNGAQFQLMVLYCSIFDIMIHGPEGYEAIQSLNITAEWDTLEKSLSSIDVPEVPGWR